VTLYAVCTVHKKTRNACFLVELKTKVDGFFGLDSKIDSSDLVIWTSKSMRRFLALNLKTNRTSVCQRENGTRHMS
jgi:hypothetical protein